MRLIYKDEFYIILGACFEVYKEKGPGFLESVYHECLELEFTYQNIPYKSQPPLNIKYKTVVLHHKYIPDFVCFDRIILEIKAVRTLSDEHRAQTINYLKSTGLKLGILINFGHYPKIEYERFPNYK